MNWWRGIQDRAVIGRMLDVEKDQAPRLAPEPIWMVSIRLAILGLCLLSVSLAASHFGYSSTIHLEALYIPIAVFFAFSALSALWVKYRPVGRYFLLLQLFVDMVLLTGVVYITGGPGSPFLFLYLPLVMSAAVFLSRFDALLTAAGSAASYSLLAYSMYTRSLPLVDGSYLVEAPSGGFFLQCVGLGSAMILVAVATSFLKGNLTSSYEMAMQSASDFSELSSAQKALFDELAEGIVTTDLEGNIQSLNPGALRILKLKDEDTEQQNLFALFKERFSSCIELDEDAHEIERKDEGGEQGVLEYRARPILNQEGVHSGYVVIFHDLTYLRNMEEQLSVQEKMARMTENMASPSGMPSLSPIPGFVGESELIQKVFRLIERVSSSEATVLVSGDSGTGKELVARAIHAKSDRSSRPFVPVNCGAIPENLIESELFGHRKGAFTGAERDHTGLFRKAEGGTLFLDEIGELPLLMQAKLLRALQEKQVRPVGSDSTLPIDVRIVAATNRNLSNEVREGRFREDLYYRLNVIHIQVPSLAERKEDLPLLIHHFLDKLSARRNEKTSLTPAALQALLAYDYPGNVRELENILERAVVFGTEVIVPENLPEHVLEAKSKPSTAAGNSVKQAETKIYEMEELALPVELDGILEEIEKKYLELALQESEGVKKRAAELLGINFRSFRYRLQKFDIDA